MNEVDSAEGLQDEARLHRLLNLADMIGPVSHEMNNVFNHMVLQAATLSRTVPTELQGQVALFRTLALRASEMLAKLDRYRDDLTSPCTAIDAGPVVLDAIRARRMPEERIQAEVAKSLPRIQTNATDLSRLLQVLLANALAAGAPVNVRVAARGDKVRFAVENLGPSLEADGLVSYFEPFAPSNARVLNNGPQRLERAAANAIARRLKTALEVQNLTPHGSAVLFELPAAEDPAG